MPDNSFSIGPESLDPDLTLDSEQRVKEPPMYRVILLNDDYTSMDFVVSVLEDVFHKTPAEAQAIMLSVHQKGSGVAGIYPREVAETKILVVRDRARQEEFPLSCNMEPV